MSLASTSIKRPVMAIVMSLVVIIFGMIGLTSLPVREYPSVDPPIINVRTSYPGANAEIIESQITEILEASINGIAGIRILTSTSSDGSSNITVEFELGVDMETAANDVRDRVSRVQNRLPRDCDPPTVAKADADANPIIMLAIRSEKRNQLELTDIADRLFKEQLQTISGISEISIYGEKRYAIRIALDPAKLSAYNLTAEDVRSQITAENVELPSGSIEGTAIDLTIRTLGLIRSPQEFEALIIKEVNGNPVKLGDLGFAQFAAENEKSINKLNGEPCVILAILPQSGANNVEISDLFKKRLEEIVLDMPEDLAVEVIMDTTDFVRNSILEVEETIILAFVFVVIIIFLFLRNWRTTLIPIIAIPISLVGAFFIMYLFSFSVNILTLLAIVLAVGIVVDDAIVVMENIFAKVEEGMSPIEAAFKGSKEIYFAIISTTIVLVCVFLPVVFLSGTTGRLFREFGIAIAGAIVISAFISLTLTPMMCSKILKPSSSQSKFYQVTERFFVALSDAYSNGLSTFIRMRWLSVVIIIGAFVAIVVLFLNLKSELAPLEDRSRITLRVSVPEGTSFESMAVYIDEISDMVRDSVPELKSMQSMVRGGWGFVRAFLVDPNERTRSQQEIADKLVNDTRLMTKGKILVTQDPTIGDRRSGQGVQYVIQAATLDKLRSILPVFMDEVQKDPTFSFADVNLKFSKPELVVNIDREKARLLDVSTTAIAQTMQLAYAGQRVDYFTMNGKQYQVIVEVDKQDRNKPDNLTALYVRSNTGNMIQLDNLIYDSIKSNTPSLYRFNRYVSATVSATMAKGYTLGDGIAAMDVISKKVLDDTYKTDLSGQAREFNESSNSIYFAFGLALLLVYLVLAAQFESFRDPLIIMFSVPLALMGTLLSLWFFDQTINIFSEIGIIMLIGLITKNGILIVEFANQRRDMGHSILKAVKDASVSRLRPILMTSLATIFGILPIALALGAGAESRVSMGIAVVGGMLFGTILTLFVVPVMYTFITSKERVIIREEDYL
ncbi:MAG: efflux RND transporter permease subunit [Bacteroidales bacterium]|jgi:multidrug efflux pump|nr:efflux RND transporter permease subunit [Bacteroidales bacterium]